MANLEIIVRVFIQVQHTSMMSLLQHTRTFDYYFGGLKEMHCEKIETLTIISRSNAIMPGLAWLYCKMLLVTLRELT